MCVRFEIINLLLFDLALQNYNANEQEQPLNWIFKRTTYLIDFIFH